MTTAQRGRPKRPSAELQAQSAELAALRPDIIPSSPGCERTELQRIIDDIEVTQAHTQAALDRMLGRHETPTERAQRQWHASKRTAEAIEARIAREMVPAVREAWRALDDVDSLIAERRRKRATTSAPTSEQIWEILDRNRVRLDAMKGNDLRPVATVSSLEERRAARSASQMQGS